MLNSKQLQKYSMPLALLAVIVLLQLFNLKVPLFSPLNLKNILAQNAAICLAALGLSFIMISGEGDMSFSGMFSMLSVVFALTANRTDSFWPACGLTVVAALAVNLFISRMVTRFGFSSFIVSIAVMFMATGVEKALHQQTTLIANPDINAFAQAEWGLPLIVWVVFAVYLIAYLAVGRTKFGFSLRVTGENTHAGIEAGMNVKLLKTLAGQKHLLFKSEKIRYTEKHENTRIKRTCGGNPRPKTTIRIFAAQAGYDCAHCFLRDHLWCR